MRSAQYTKKLYQCESFQEQKAWVREKLLEGATLTDPFLFLAGADPDRIIRALRRDGLPIKTVRVRTIDAAGAEHPRTLAWRIEQ